ncbi:hypothetical protein C8Q78DRAFT_623670 [Trametes maxima]|nr:hypothetical protein C8Q78DRAFT_623670 [Trametes maxima]
MDCVPVRYGSSSFPACMSHTIPSFLVLRFPFSARYRTPRAALARARSYLTSFSAHSLIPAAARCEPSVFAPARAHVLRLVCFAHRYSSARYRALIGAMT